MIVMTRLWIVTYVSDFRTYKAKFIVYDDNGKIIYKISDKDEKEMVVTKESGNDFYKLLLSEYEGRVNKIL